jgi:hypothetical protein
MFDMHRLPHGGRISRKQFTSWVLGDSGPRTFVHLFHEAQGLPDIHAEVQHRNLEQGAIFQLLAHGQLFVTAQELFASKEFRRTLGDASDAEVLALIGLMFDDSDGLLVTRSNGSRETEVAWCDRIAELIEQLYEEDKDVRACFGMPVDLTQHPTYLKRIAPNEPLDLGTVLHRLRSRQYNDLGKVYDDINLVWENAARYEKGNFKAASVAHAAKLRFNELLLSLHSNKKIYNDHFHDVLRPWNIFNECDLDHSHTLDCKELEIILWFQLRKRPSPELLRSFIEFIDFNNDGAISRKEWVKAILDSDQAQKEAQSQQSQQSQQSVHRRLEAKDSQYFSQLVRAG